MVDITGKKDALKIKEEYQGALNHTHGAIKNKIDWLYGMNHKLKDNLALVQKYKKDILSDQEERDSLYTSLNNLLLKETNFEKEMLKESNKNKKSSKVIIKPRIKDSDIDDFRINAIKDYLDKYPEYASKSSFKKILEKITEIESGIKHTKNKYNHHVSEVLRELAYWPRNIMEAENLVKRFRSQFNEADEKLKNMRYLKSIFYKFASESTKMNVNIHTLYYKVDEFESTIKQLKEEYLRAKKQDLEEMDY
jgi:hypothetical protein